MLHSETPCVGSSRIRCTEAREAEGPPQSGRGESEFLPHRIASAVSVLYARFKFCCVHRMFHRFGYRIARLGHCRLSVDGSLIRYTPVAVAKGIMT